MRRRRKHDPTSGNVNTHAASCRCPVPKAESIRSVSKSNQGRWGGARMCITYEDEHAADRPGGNLLRCGVHHGARSRIYTRCRRYQQQWCQSANVAWRMRLVCASIT